MREHILKNQARVKSHEVAQKCSQSGCQEVIKQSQWLTNAYKATTNWSQNDHQLVTNKSLLKRPHQRVPK